MVVKWKWRGDSDEGVGVGRSGRAKHLHPAYAALPFTFVSCRVQKIC